MRRHGNLSDEQQLAWLYRNLLPEYRQQIRRTDFKDFTSFCQEVKEFELLRKELQNIPSTSGWQRGTNQRFPPANTSRNLNATASPAQEPEASTSSSRPSTLCWRCGETGHVRTNCRNPLKIFCSRCRKEGVLTRDCYCSKPEN